MTSFIGHLRETAYFMYTNLETAYFIYTYSLMHFAFIFPEYIIFSEYITNTSSEEALKVCEHSFFQEI